MPRAIALSSTLRDATINCRHIDREELCFVPRVIALVFIIRDATVKIISVMNHTRRPYAESSSVRFQSRFSTSEVTDLFRRMECPL